MEISDLGNGNEEHKTYQRRNMNKTMKFYPSSSKKQIFKIAEGKMLLSGKNSMQYHSVCRWTQDKLISELIFRFATPLQHVSRLDLTLHYRLRAGLSQ